MMILLKSLRKIVVLITFFVTIISSHAQQVDVQYLNPKIGTTSSTHQHIRVGHSGDYRAAFLFNNSSNTYGDGDDFSILTYNNRDLTFFTGTGNVIFFPSGGGLVGIDTKTPLAKLDIAAGGDGVEILRLSTDRPWTFVQDGSEGTSSLALRSVINGDKKFKIQDSNGFDAFNIGAMNGNSYFKGRMGIGTNNPNSMLEVNGVGSAGTNTANFNNTYVSISENYKDNRPVSIRRHSSSSESLNIFLQDNATFFTYDNDEASSKIHFRLVNNDIGNNGSNSTDYNAMTLFANANGSKVGIGTTAPVHELDVMGTIHAKEVLVDLTVEGPDYVFEPDYDLKNLTDLDQYLKVNKHLPEVPSAAQMKAEGVNMLEMQMLLLKKVEELTLHLIEQKAEKDFEINTLKVRLDQQEKIIKSLLSSENE